MLRGSEDAVAIYQQHLVSVIDIYHYRRVERIEIIVINHYESIDQIYEN